MKLPDVGKGLKRLKKRRRTASWVGMPQTLNDCDGSHTFSRPVKDTSRPAVKGNPSILQKFMAIPKTAYCRYEWTHMLDVHDAWKNEMMATHCDHPVVQDSETPSETPFMQPLRRPPSMLEHPAASEYRTNERL